MRHLLNTFCAALRGLRYWRGLRCRPGDICWVNRTLYATIAQTGERIVTVKGGTVVRVVTLDSDQHWTIESPIPVAGTGHAVAASGRRRMAYG